MLPYNVVQTHYNPDIYATFSEAGQLTIRLQIIHLLLFLIEKENCWLVCAFKDICGRSVLSSSMLEESLNEVIFMLIQSF